MSTGHPLTEEQVSFIRRNFGNMTNQELADAAGCSKSAVCNVQKRFHLRKSAEHYHDAAIKAGKASSEARGGKALGITPEIIEKRVASYRKTFREEQVRYKWGFPQQTKIRVRKSPKPKIGQRSYLKSLGYILDEANCIAYYTDSTTRAVRMERNWSKKVKQYYHFKPYPEEQHGLEIHER